MERVHDLGSLRDNMEDLNKARDDVQKWLERDELMWK